MKVVEREVKHIKIKPKSIILGYTFGCLKFNYTIDHK